ncbi:DUF6973 domain-containing protein [Plantactinospora sp. KLBMP9567]|uniref:DUF6973 domain-containing protein n=1 Tax=Plantactinospora sp. KLBMP9567 TaxID=3085900 RepID=UPI0029814EF2|nr:hypothetical protein [Plantactinospora sp. KLBMP9567]MDW5325494.1 hypothetical protein [Plantactinospora sp. KLBMP9567]
MAEYQVVEDPNRDKFPDPPLSWVVDQRRLTASEAGILRELQQTRGLLGLQKFKDIHDEAFAVADARFASPDRNDDHNDAFRHAYWKLTIPDTGQPANTTLPGHPQPQKKTGS